MKQPAAPVFGVASVPLLSAAHAAAQDRAAHDDGIPGRLLMENAARSAALVLSRLYPEGTVVVLAGSGNNGGDALVLARTLRAWGREAAVVLAGQSPGAELLHGHDVPILEGAAAEKALGRAAVIVDGLLGTGATGAARGGALDWIRHANASGVPILALDLPSGVDATTGAVPGDAIRADVTVTFGSPKAGLLLQPARERCGRLIAVEIGFPPHAAMPADAELITPAWAAARLPARRATAHKNTEGRVLIAAGSPRMGGAAVLAVLGAFRTGAGLVRVLTAPGNRSTILRRVPEAIVGDIGDPDDVSAHALHANALVLGPGLGTGEEAAAAIAMITGATTGVPSVFDADALNHFAADRAALAGLAAARPLVVTPHPGEMARLAGITTDQVTADPIGTAKRFASETGCVVLLKGAPSVVASPEEPTLVSSVGSSDLAKAGMGDLLAGCIGAFLAQGCPGRDAAALALFYTGLAAEQLGMGRSLKPTDVAGRLGDAFASRPLAHSPLALPFITFDQPPRW